MTWALVNALCSADASGDCDDSAANRSSEAPADSMAELDSDWGANESIGPVWAAATAAAAAAAWSCAGSDCCRAAPLWKANAATIRTGR